MSTFSFCVNKGGILTQCVVDAEADLAVYGNGANITRLNAPLFRSLLTFRSGGGIKGGKPVCSLVESLCNTEKRCHKPAPTRAHNWHYSSLSHARCRQITTLTFSVSRSFTVGNGVLVDILCASQAAQRCSGAGQTRRGPSGRAVPLSFSTSPVNNTADCGSLPQHSAHRAQLTRQISLLVCALPFR